MQAQLISTELYQTLINIILKKLSVNFVFAKGIINYAVYRLVLYMQQLSTQSHTLVCPVRCAYGQSGLRRWAVKSELLTTAHHYDYDKDDTSIVGLSCRIIFCSIVFTIIIGYTFCKRLITHICRPSVVSMVRAVLFLCCFGAFFCKPS